MAASRICRRIPQFLTNSLLNPTKRTEFLTAVNIRSHSSLSTSSPPTTTSTVSNNINADHISQLVTDHRLFLMDTFALMKRLEGEGYTAKQAEAITEALTKTLNDSLENVAHFFMTKPEIHRYETTKESNLATFKTEIQSSQEHHFSMLQRETEKLQGHIEKLRSDLKYGMDKVTAGQRLDLNLERGRIRDELATQDEETNNLTNKLDKEIQSLRAQLEAQKSEVLKYCTGVLVVIFAAGISVVRALL